MSELTPQQIQRLRDEFANSPGYNHVRRLLDHIDGEPARIARAKADAWDEGMNAAFQSFLRPLKYNYTRDLGPNPYREDQ